MRSVRDGRAPTWAERARRVPWSRVRRACYGACGCRPAARAVACSKMAKRSNRTLGLAFGFWHAFELRQPGQPSLGPDLLLRTAERIRLAERAKPQRIGLGIVLSARVHRRAARSAERMHAARTAVRDFDVLARLAGEDAEAFRRCRYAGAERGAGKHLAVPAVAHVHRACFHFRLVGDLAAMAAPLDFHGMTPSLRFMNRSLPLL